MRNPIRPAAAGKIRMRVIRLLALTASVLLYEHARSNPPNPIQQENAKEGTFAWQLVNPATDHEIEGYASLTSVNRGGQISLFVNTADPSYTITIFRMGWYGGRGGREVMAPISRPGTVQTNQTYDPATGLVECNWVDPFVLTIPDDPSDPTDWASGVYLAKLWGSQSGKEGFIIFVVRDDDRPSDVLFQFNRVSLRSKPTTTGADTPFTTLIVLTRSHSTGRTTVRYTQAVKVLGSS